MLKQDRRSFLKTSALIGAGITGLKSKDTKAQTRHVISEDRMGVLVDTTVCIGCRKCEWACKTAHDLPAGDIESYEDRSVYEKMRRPDDKALTVVNEYSNPDPTKLPTNVKVQCMHCDEPACLSACIVGAFSKDESGSVVWDTEKCIGCRYCMIACPFQIPAFEYDKALQPDIKKCDFCIERTTQGQLPACVEICPVEALTYGRRKDLIEVARKKIKNYPDRYIDSILGDTEVGGTSWMYLSGRDFQELDFPKLGEDPAPGVSESIQHGIFAYFVPPISLYALLGGVMWLNKKKEKSKEE
ncbi:MAG: 4Fe-4S dicluster domain-containing protein [Melioribacteraceae bacterium]|nr:4Fe-4S dicluster domain-containing protein [Melioribacteraceae bacterium]MCF8353999.1 4Fe-4S dicluster domain-containing protein [Melioribacteraceae bacterium]MCF8392320.1 4Fe-4S dicluster domain-containing protein [Melioribacteraceae bacterium]MCF8417652.1 4Fe-4S dicluster domain-containing protein [Melioribacteraceae bacterium]